MKDVFFTDKAQIGTKHIPLKMKNGGPIKEWNGPGYYESPGYFLKDITPTSSYITTKEQYNNMFFSKELESKIDKRRKELGLLKTGGPVKGFEYSIGGLW